jgi:hypothetical protein
MFLSVRSSIVALALCGLVLAPLACGGSSVDETNEQKEDDEKPPVPGAENGETIDSGDPDPEPYEGPCRGVRDCAAGEQCIFGSCVSEPANCSLEEATCDVVVPDCGDGMTPAIVDGCFDGCVPLETCGFLSGCDACDAAGRLCLVWSTEDGAVQSCASDATPDDCTTCDCLPDDVCGVLSCVEVNGSEIQCVSLGEE